MLNGRIKCNVYLITHMSFITNRNLFISNNQNLISMYPPTLLCNFTNGKTQNVLQNYSLNKQKNNNYQVSSENQLRSISSRDCSSAAIKFALNSELVKTNTPVQNGVTTKFTNQHFYSSL